MAKSRMSTLPVIGITTYGRNTKGRFHLPGDYVDAVRAGGGLPVLLPPGEAHIGDILRVIDGLILSGGEDIDPRLYKGMPHPSIERVDPERDAFELALARAVLEGDLPVLGICRGHQMLNVATGGDLIPHLPEWQRNGVVHRGDQEREVIHPVQVEPGTRLAEILGVAEVPTVSLHHQGMGKISPEWQPCAYAPDGLVEAQEHRDHPWMIAVQWHPEMAYREPAQIRIFQALVSAALVRKKG